MRIAIDCRPVFAGMGGIGHHTESLVRAIAKADSRHQYTLLFTARKNEGRLVGSDRFQELTFEAGMIDPVWEQVQLPSVLSENEIELYHSPCFALPAVKTTKWRVATVHDVVFRTHPELVASGLRDYLDRWTEHSLEVADAVITVSEFSKSEIVRAYGTPGEKVHVIPNGVEDRFRRRYSKHAERELRQKLGLSGRFVLYVGSLEPKKNISRLLKAFAMVLRSARAEGLRLVLAGGRGGQEYDVDAEIERAGIGKHVMVIGYLPDAEIPVLMRAAALFVYPSLYEGFGLPPLEAMACGTPVVVSNSSSLPEVVGDAALIAPAEETDRLAEAVERGLFDKAVRKTLVRKGLGRVLPYTWSRAAEQTLEVYEMVAEGVT